jgi:hypothetical protein
MAPRVPTEPLPGRLQSLRDHRLRLSPRRFLSTLEDARAFLSDRGILTTLPSCSLPSLFGACAPPKERNARGWDRWPQDKWWWDTALGSSEGVLTLKVLRGKRLFVDDRLIPAFDAVCRACLVDADNGEYGGDVAALVHELSVSGPINLDEMGTRLGLDAGTVRRARSVAERLGAVVSREIEVPARNGGHRHTSELRRWDQISPTPTAVPAAERVDNAIEAGVTAAIASSEHEAERWFTWPSHGAAQRLVDQGRLTRPCEGWVATPTSST